VTVTNDKGRLNKQDFERIVDEAERFKQQDEGVKRKVQAKKRLESYAYNVNNNIDEEKISLEDRNSIGSKIMEINRWIENNPDAAVEQFESKQKEIENMINFIMKKIYLVAGSATFLGGNAGGHPGT
jgi:L1 cell adhesion molecule like protein